MSTRIQQVYRLPYHCSFCSRFGALLLRHGLSDPAVRDNTRLG